MSILLNALSQAAFIAIFALSAFAQGVGPSQGPDVIVGFVDGTSVFGRQGTGAAAQVGVSAGTNSCNRGTANLNWYANDNRHPVISLNLYRLLNDRMEQLAGSWVKHGFAATNETECLAIPQFPHTQCKPAQAGSRELGPGCSDLYSEQLNSNPQYLGPRSKINPTTGLFDNTTAKDLTGYPASTPLDRILLVSESDLVASDAKYFVEAHYVTADDAAAGNARNNATFREIKPVQGTNRITFQHLFEEFRGEPALRAWPGAKFFEKSEVEASGGQRGTIIVASKAIRVSGNLHRYEYAIYNMNSDLAVQSFTVPTGTVQTSTIGFRAVPSNGELWSNDPWISTVAGNAVTWATKKYADLPTANAIRWGTTYNLWFVADSAPSTKAAVVVRFKPKAGAPSPDSFEAEVLAPSN